MLVPVLIEVLVVANCVHVPLLLLYHVAVMVWLSESLQTTYNAGVVHILVCPSVGLGLVCVGMLLVVKEYVVLVQLHPSVRLTDQ